MNKLISAGKQEFFPICHLEFDTCRSLVCSLYSNIVDKDKVVAIVDKNELDVSRSCGRGGGVTGGVC